MASPNSTFTEIVTTTLRNRSGKTADNVSNGNAILSMLKKQGGWQSATGRSIVQELEYSEGNFQWYSGYETITITPPDVFTAAEYDWKQAASSVSISGLEKDVQNTGKETHEFLALKLGAGASLDQLVRPTSDTFPSNIQVIGQETVAPGETRTLVFVDLAPGTYTVVCLLPDADGVPHLALGETATFTVS